MVHLAGCDAGMCVYRETGQCDTIMWMAQRHTLRTSGLARDVASSTICWCSVFLLPSVKALRPICLTHAPRTDEIGTVSKKAVEEGRSEGRSSGGASPYRSTQQWQQTRCALQEGFLGFV